VPDAEIVIVEPEGWDDMARSLDGGEIVAVEPDAPDTFCDAIMTPRVSPITFGILRDHKATATSVSDAEVAEAIRFAWNKHGIVVEPGAAVALAAVLAGKIAPLEDTVIVVSGGNIDSALHARIIAGA
jgi:threonine dehydratase